MVVLNLAFRFMVAERDREVYGGLWLKNYSRLRDLASISLPSGLGGWVRLDIGMSQAADSLVPAAGAPLCAGVALPGAANWLRNPKSKVKFMGP